MKNILISILFTAGFFSLTGCSDIGRHNYKCEMNDGTLFNFVADGCQLYNEKQDVGCFVGNQFIFQAKWGNVKHFTDLTEEKRIKFEKEIEERNKQPRNNDGGSGGLGLILGLHILGII